MKKVKKENNNRKKKWQSKREKREKMEMKNKKNHYFFLNKIAPAPTPNKTQPISRSDPRTELREVRSDPFPR